MTATDDKIAQLEARLATLEARACRCMACQDAEVARVKNAAIEARAAIWGAPNALDQIRALPLAEQNALWKDLCVVNEARAIELLTSDEVSARELERWFHPAAAMRLRDKVMIRIVEVPTHTRLKITTPGFRIDGSAVFALTAAFADKAQKAGLPVHFANQQYTVSSVRGVNINGAVFQSSALDLLLTIDADLREAFEQGHIGRVDFSDEENRGLQLQKWREIPYDQRPKLPRKKRVGKPTFRFDGSDGTAGFDKGGLA